MPLDTVAAPVHPARAVSPYLALWHRRFAGLDPAYSAPVELWFDRGSAPPLLVATRAPLGGDAAEKRLAALHVAALINNTLCVHGAAAVTILSPQADDVARYLRDAAQRLLFLPEERFSTMPLGFLRCLAGRVFSRTFCLDSDPAHGASLREKRRAAAHAGKPGPAAPRPGLVLAVNIGQHLASLALVDVAADGRFSVTELSRRRICPSGDHPFLPAILDGMRPEAKRLAARAGDALAAVGLSIAATVVRGKVAAVSGYGLSTGCPGEPPEAVDALLADFCREIAPDRPLAVVNDGMAQAVFAHRHGGGQDAAPQAGHGGDMLSVRLGTSPAVHRLDASGRAAPGFHEYAWCVTRFLGNAVPGARFATVHPYLSHSGVAVIAHELGLLGKYRLFQDAAPAFFRDALEADAPGPRQDAAHVYGILGAHLAMFAHELHRDRPLATVRLLGSRANRLDAVAFAAIAAGFTAFAAAHDLGLEGVELTLIEEASAVAGLVGAAHAALEAAPPHVRHG